MLRDELKALVEDSFWDGISWKIISLLLEATEENQYLEIIVEKIIESLNDYLISLDQNEAIVKNILKILTDVLEILQNNPKQGIMIAECMLRIATEEKVPLNILKCAIYNLNLLLKDVGAVTKWLRNNESLEGYLLILGRKLPIVGDFECQSNMFETLCYIVFDNENKHKWIHSWFTDDEKTRSMFLNWDLDNFTVESRKILNQINRRELCPRTYAFAATAVYFGNIQLQKLNGLEFWIDFNYDSESVSFFCKDFEEKGQDYTESWETVVISSDIVESYTVQKKEDFKSIELYITLNCPCSDLVLSQIPSCEPTNLVRIIFWIYVDISSHLRVIFGDPVTLNIKHAVNSQGSQRTQKVSLSVDALEFHNQNDISAAGKSRKISDSVVKIQEDYCEEKKRRFSDSAELVCLPGDDACEAPDKLAENNLSENNFLGKGQINDDEIKLSRKGTSENELHLSDKDAVSNEPRNKRLKKNSEDAIKRKSSTSKLSKRKPNYVEKEGLSDETPPKKQRKAAIKAMEKNKTMLEQKELGTYEVFSEKSSNINLSNDEIGVLCTTPPTKPVKKRRLKSVFFTDTETGSSNVSWIGGKKSCLFETPQKRYSKRRKSKQASKSTSLKKKTYKSTTGISKRKQNSNLSMNGFEIRSKSGLSDLENYDLVVERKTDRKKSSNSSHKHFTFKDVSNAINAAVEGMAENQLFEKELDKKSNNSNIKSRVYENIQTFEHDGGLHTDKSKEKVDFIDTERSQTNIGGKGFKSNVADEQKMVEIKPKSSSSKKRNSRNSQSLFQDRNTSSNPEVHQKSVSNDLPLSSSVKKRKSASPVKKRKSDNLPAPKEKAKRRRKDNNNSQGFIYDSITHANSFNMQDSIGYDEILPDIPSTLAAQILESSNTLEKDRNSFSSMSKKAHGNSFHPTCLSPKVDILSEHSLSSLVSENDEAAGKEFHMQRFLEDISGESNSPKHFEFADIHQPVTLQSNKKRKSKVSYKSDDLLEHSTSEKQFLEDVKSLELSSSRKKHFISFDESNERSKASSEKGLQKFSSLDNHSDSGLQEVCFERCVKEDNHQKITKINGTKSLKQPSVLQILGVATDNMTHKLLKTLQKHFYNFNVRITASREKILETADALLSKENDWDHKSLKNIAKASKIKRIQAEKSLNQILLAGQEYFEAEKKLDRKMKRLHKKAFKKYAASIRLAGRYAIDALEVQAAAKTEILLKSIVKKIEHL